MAGARGSAWGDVAARPSWAAAGTGKGQGGVPASRSTSGWARQRGAVPGEVRQPLTVDPVSNFGFIFWAAHRLHCQHHEVDPLHPAQELPPVHQGDTL